MIKAMLERLSWGVALVVVLAFFLPWLKYKPHAANSTEQAAQELVEEAERPWYEAYFAMRNQEMIDALKDPLQGTSGFSLLMMARSDVKEERVKAAEMMKYLVRVNLHEACIFVYSIPATVLIGACFLTAVPKGKWVFLIPLILSLLLFVLVRKQLNEMYFERLVLDLSAGLGLWTSIYGLVVMTGFLIARTIIGFIEK